MRRFFIIIILALLTCMAVQAKSWIGESEDSVFVEKVLAEAKAKKPTGSLSLFFARKFIGRPYVAHTLEVGDDRRVVVNTRELDCTTLVENVTALTLCAQRGQTSFAKFVETLRQLRYRGGRMNGYTSRLHYFTDWIIDNTKAGVVSERQTPNPPFTATQTVNVGYMSAHPSAYKALKEHPEYVATIAATEKSLNGKTFKYIPKSKVANTKALRSAVKDGDIIAITCNKKGLDIAHLGFAVWQADGLHLLNASMIHHKVVSEPMTLRKYLQQHKSHTGIRIIRIKN